MTSQLVRVTCLLLATMTATQARDLEAGIAITQPDVMTELDAKGYSLGALLSPQWQRGPAQPIMTNRQLSALPALKNVLAVSNRRLNRCTVPDQTTGVGIACLKRLFDQRYLYADFARFELVGVINRMDRAWQPKTPCGEVRLLYRLAYATTTNEGPTRSRLPMSLNLVFNAKPPGHDITCAQLANRWLNAADQTLPPKQLAARMMANSGVLALVSPTAFDRIETNIQSQRQPATIVPEFGGYAEYQLAVYRYNPTTKGFDTQLMENQINREKLLVDAALLDRLKQWLLQPIQIQNLDRGTIDIPREFLTTKAITVAPGGASRSRNRPFDGLISDEEITTALNQTQSNGLKLKNISTPYGFQRRLNDITCVGCHQSRAIGGFHFMGADRRENLDNFPANAIFVPASAHFYGEAPRRRQIVEDLAIGREPDYLRGFSARPRKSLTRGLDGTGHYNGWSAACYTGDDKSFKPWTCAPGLTCKVLHETTSEPGMGLCVTKGKPKIGDAVEFGQVTTLRYGVDTFTRVTPPPGAKLVPPTVQLDPRREAAAAQAGGFFGGMMRTKKCVDLPTEAVCSRAAGNGFNECLGEGHNFETCVTNHTNLEGLRACDQRNPCRDDYICVATAERGRGACLPPYFLFQFRVDGHPVNFTQPP
jgi:hypothetical protein